MNEDDRFALQQLRWATQAIALEPDQQLSLFPDFVDKPFELVDDFDNWFRATHWRPNVIPAPCMDLLNQLNGKLLSLSDDERSEGSIRTSQTWANLRILARRVLSDCNWPNSPPPTDRNNYVPAS